MKTVLPGPIEHGNKGKQNRVKGTDTVLYIVDLKLYLHELGELHGESYATHFIQERTSIQRMVSVAKSSNWMHMS